MLICYTAVIYAHRRLNSKPALTHPSLQADQQASHTANEVVTTHKPQFFEKHLLMRACCCIVPKRLCNALTNAHTCTPCPEMQTKGNITFV